MNSPQNNNGSPAMSVADEPVGNLCDHIVAPAPREVKELRALSPDQQPIVGHYDNPQDFHQQAAQLNAAGLNIYSPINPIRFGVFNQLNVLSPTGNAAGEQDIARRAWLPYDIDAVRGKGQTATDEQRLCARGMADEIISFWRDRGVTARVVDSGNGYQVLVPIDLPNDAESSALIKRVLETHKQQFDTPGAKLDVLFDAPRIMRIPGYINWKGDGPHRTVTLIQDASGLAAWEMLDAIAPAPEPVTPSSGIIVRAGNNYDKAALNQQKVEELLGMSLDWRPAKEPHLWMADLDEELCPNADLHSQSNVRGTFVVTISRDGQIGAKCNHSNCSEVQWVHVRAKFGKKNPESPRAFILTEGGNAERLVAEHKDNFRYLLDDQVWLAWDGRRWKRDATAEIHAAAKATVRHMRHMAADIENDEERKRFSTFCNVSDRRASRENMVALARYEPEVKELRGDFDCHPWLLNVQNGTIDLHSGQLRAHDRADMLTQIAPITYDPSAPCPRWLQFLAETFPDPANKSVKQDVIDFLRRAIGYTLTGETGEHKFWLLLGGGRNGKGVFLNVIKALLGDYAAETSFDTFTAKRADAAAINPRDGLATLVGKRFIKASESSEGKRFDDALVKKVTGGDSVRTAKVYGDEFEYMPQFKIWLATNIEPKVTGVDDGIWSRILRVNFDHQVPEEKRDVQLVAKIVAEELPGILNWALAGLRDYRANGLRVPVAVVGAVSEYRHDQNPLVDFLTARYDRTGAPDDTVPGSELLKDYNEWARMNRARVLTSQALGLATKALEVPSRRAGRDKQTVCSGLKRKTTGPVIGGAFGNAW
jgi:P4 family phage/plasmid primase-like protien